MESFYPHRSLRLSASRSSGRVECEEKTGIRQRKTKSHTHWVAETSMQGARIFFSRRYPFIFFFIARPSHALLHLNTLLQGFAFFWKILWQPDCSTSNRVPMFTFIATIFLFFFFCRYRKIPPNTLDIFASKFMQRLQMWKALWDDTCFNSIATENCRISVTYVRFKDDGSSLYYNCLKSDRSLCSGLTR